MASTSYQKVAIDLPRKLEAKDLPVLRRLARDLSSFIYETTWQGQRQCRKDFPIELVAGKSVFENESKGLFDLDHPSIVKCFGYTIGKSACSLLQEYVDDNLQSIMQKRIELQRQGSSSSLSSRVLSIEEIKELLSSPSKEKEIVVTEFQGSFGLGSTIPFDLSEAFDIISQIAIGMKYLHDNAIVHGDLKPKNVLVHQGSHGKFEVKINDFGLLGTKKHSRLDSKRRQHFDTLMWKAPELLDELLGPSTKYFDNSFSDSDTDEDDIEDGFEEIGSSSDFEKDKLSMGDVYSFGLTCLYIVGGELMHPNLRLIQFQNKRLDAFRPKLPLACPKLLNSLICRCLEFEPWKRPTFSTIVANFATPTLKAYLSNFPNSLEVAFDDLIEDDEGEPNNAFTLKNRGDLKRMLKDFEGALVDLNKADEVEPHDAFTLKTRGDVKRILRDYEGALVDLNKADEGEPNDAFTLKSRGAVKRMLKDFEGALVDLNKADEVDPHDAFTLKTRGDVKRILRDFEGALVDLNKADELEPNDAYTLKIRGDVKQMLSDDEGALVDLNKADEVEPHDSFTLKIRGAVKRMLSDYEGALVDLNNANEVEPHDASTLKAHGVLKRMLSDFGGALVDLNKANEIEPNDAFTLKIRGDVKQMLSDDEQLAGSFDNMLLNTPTASHASHPHPWDDQTFLNPLSPVSVHHHHDPPAHEYYYSGELNPIWLQPDDATGSHATSTAQQQPTTPPGYGGMSVGTGETGDSLESLMDTAGTSTMSPYILPPVAEEKASTFYKFYVDFRRIARGHEVAFESARRGRGVRVLGKAFCYALRLRKTVVRVTKAQRKRIRETQRQPKHRHQCNWKRMRTVVPTQPMTSGGSTQSTTEPRCKGISLRNGRWHSEIRVSSSTCKTKVWIGTFSSEKEAALAFDAGYYHCTEKCKEFNYPLFVNQLGDSQYQTVLALCNAGREQDARKLVRKVAAAHAAAFGAP